MELKNDLLLRVARGEKVERPPVWVMRQAGRYLSEYKEVRKTAGSFRQMIANPDFAIEVSLQPIDLMGVDAAIIFSDILVLPEAIGLTYEMVPGKGPFFPKTIETARDIDQLHEIEEQSNLEHTYTALEGVSKALNGRVPLIGFIGAPWTIFCYMLEGQGSKTFSKAKAFFYREPQLAHRLLEKITSASITYLKGQIRAGAQIVQIFDSWAGILDRKTFKEFSLPYLKAICDAIQEVPKTVFAKGAFFALDELDKLDCQIIGLDWHTPVEYARSQVKSKALQGNLDPALLYSKPEEVRSSTLEMLKKFPAGRHVANLGHGVYPDMPRECVKTFVDTVKEFRY